MDVVTIRIGESDVKILFHADPECPFTGKKLIHPFETETIEIELPDKKGGTRTVQELAYKDGYVEGADTELVHPATKFYVKFDGSCGQIRNGVARRRHDRKVDRKTGNWKPLPFEDKLNYTPCGEEPKLPEGEVPTSFHYPHMRDVTADKRFKAVGDKWFADAAERFQGSPWFEAHRDQKLIMGEWMGPKIQGCASDPLEANTFMPFNMVEVVIPVELRTFSGFRQLFTLIPNIEGVVAYCPNAIYKIRRNMYLNEFGRMMGWGRKSPDQMTIVPELKAVFNKAGVPNFAQYVVNRAQLC